MAPPPHLFVSRTTLDPIYTKAFPIDRLLRSYARVIWGKKGRKPSTKKLNYRLEGRIGTSYPRSTLLRPPSSFPFLPPPVAPALSSISPPSPVPTIDAAPVPTADATAVPVCVCSFADPI
jgi:hypothetical protein